MKTILLVISFICALFYQYGFAQITITGNDMPKPGRTNILAYDTTTNINFGSPSSSQQSWDFSGLLNHYTRFATYSPVTNNQQYQNIYSGAEIYTYGPGFWFGMLYGTAPVSIYSWGYLFFSSDQQGLKIVGFNSNGSGAANVIENPQELLMGTPASLDSVFPNYSNWEIPLNVNTADNIDTVYRKSAIKTLTCDAFGSLTTPLGIFDVLRVHEYVTKFDSVHFTFFGFPFDTLIHSDTLNNYYFWANNVNYPIATVFADKNNNVLNIEYLKDTMLPAQSISGQVLTTNGPAPVTSGTASLKIRSPWNHLFTTYETVSLVNNGHFQFSSMYGDSLIPGNYLIFVDPDSLAYPYHIPTYYGNETHWENATVLQLVSDTSVYIRLQNDSAFMNMNGPGSISGQITFTQTKSYTTNADKIKVVLEENPGGVTRLHTGVNENGNYYFNNIDTTQNYKIRVEIAGLVMDTTHFINFTQQQTNFIDRNFIYDTLKIDITGGAYIPENNFVNSGISFYPNPFSSDCTLKIEKDDAEIYTLELKIFDITGREIQHLTKKGSNFIHFNKATMKSGIYFVYVTVNNQYSYKGKIIVR